MQVLLVTLLCGLSYGSIFDLCITDIVARECSVPAFYGAYKNKRFIDINTKKLSVANYETGQSLKTLEVPGNYRLTFSDVKIHHDLEYFFADMELTLRTPVFPNVNILGGCDGRSHKVSVDGQGSKYCRYCDLCKLTKDIEEHLEHKQVLAFSNSETVRWDASCEKLKAGHTYSVSRYINLPTPEAFEEKYGTGLDTILESALDGGEGTIEAQLRLLSLKDRVRNGKQFSRQECINQCLMDRTKSSAACIRECSGQQSQANQQQYNEVFAVEGSVCNASTGFLNNYDLAACYTVEFKFTAKERPAGATQPVCDDSADFNPCKGQNEACCRNKQKHLANVYQCTRDCMDYRGNCRKLFRL